MTFLINEPRQELLTTVLAKIHREERKLAFKKGSAFLALFFGSILTLIPTSMQLFNAMSASGFLQYLSLGFSDSAIIVSNINSYLLSVVESFPTVEITGTLIVLLICFYSLRSIINNYQSLRQLGKQAAQ